MLPRCTRYEPLLDDQPTCDYPFDPEIIRSHLDQAAGYVDSMPSEWTHCNHDKTAGYQALAEEILAVCIDDIYHAVNDGLIDPDTFKERNYSKRRGGYSKEEYQAAGFRVNPNGTLAAARRRDAAEALAFLRGHFAADVLGNLSLRERCEYDPDALIRAAVRRAKPLKPSTSTDRG